jgi:amidase
MQHLSIGPLYYEYSRHNSPRITVDPGEVFSVDTEDAFSGQIRSDDDRRDKTKVPGSNPQTGPIFVRGAMPGDALAVTIHSIEPLLGQCATRTGDARDLARWLGSDCPHGVHVCPIRDGQIHWSSEVTIPYTPMLGCIGTAPASGVPTTLPAGPHGGNMDIVEVCPGNTVLLPVFVEGGYLYLGDAHAAMGHGELSASGLEMPAKTILSIEVRKHNNLPSPRIESATEIMTIVSGSPMEQSLAQAFSYLILWMESDFGVPRWRAYDLLTHVAKISVGYFPIATVCVKVDRKYLQAR